jgi:hypothetical protein
MYALVKATTTCEARNLGNHKSEKSSQTLLPTFRGLPRRECNLLAEEALEFDWGNNLQTKRHSAHHLLQGTEQPPPLCLGESQPHCRISACHGLGRQETINLTHIHCVARCPHAVLGSKPWLFRALFNQEPARKSLSGSTASRGYRRSINGKNNLANDSTCA